MPSCATASAAGSAASGSGKSPGVVGFRARGTPAWTVWGVSLRALGWAIA